MSDLEVFYVAFVAVMLGAGALCTVCSAAVKGAQVVSAVMGGVACTGW